MDRRTCLNMLVAGSLFGAASLARAQQTGKVRRLGILTAGTVASEWVPFFEALRKLGWIEDQNLLIERRGAGGKAELVPGLAEELVQLRPDVIVTNGAVASLAVKNATTTIPIVSVTGDPVLHWPRRQHVAAGRQYHGHVDGSPSSPRSVWNS